MKTKKSMGDRAFTLALYIGFGIFTVLCAYPFYYLIINSISANDASALRQINFWPRGIHFQNYVEILRLPGISRAALVSVGRTAIGATLTVLASGYLGFMFTQRKMWRRSFWYRFVIITMYFNAGMIPIFMTMRTLNLTNTFWVYIIPAIVQPFNIILVKTYVESISSSLQEAAEIDGAGILTVFFKIILPICKPILATVAIFAAVGQWSAFQDTLLFITDSSLWTLQFLLYTYLNQAHSLAALIQQTGVGHAAVAAAMRQTPLSIQMTISVVVTLPILFVYPFLQRYFVKGIMIGSVKG